jgi:ABC-type dipeptide/oligopeptide/nickel transport system ATPase component
VHRETPVSANAIHRALDALGRTIEQRDAEIAHYRRQLAAERAERQALAGRLRHAERLLAQHTPTVALDLTPATRPDLYSVGIEGAA